MVVTMKAGVGAVRPGVISVFGRRRASLWLPLAVVVVSAAVFAVARPTLIDDTHITLSYARELAFHGHWGMISDSVANSATSPANVLLLAALTLVLRNPILAAGALYVLTQLATVLALRRVAETLDLSRWFAPLALGLLTVNPLLLSALGMEVSLGTAIVSWLFLFALRGQLAPFGLMAGMLALVRLDLALLAVVLFLVRPRFWVGAWRAVLAALAVALPWYLFSWFALGSAVPDTLIIKTMQGTWGQWGFGNGPWMYLGAYPFATVLSFLPLLFAVLALLGWLAFLGKRGPIWRKLRPCTVLLLAAAVHYLAYTLLIVPPYHWYYGPAISLGCVFSAAVLTSGSKLLGWLGRGFGWALVLFSLVWYALPGVPRSFAPITTNWASTVQYGKIGRQLHRIVGDRAVHSGGEIGVLAYSCDCAIVDAFSDRGVMLNQIREARAQASGFGKTMQDVNFTFLDDRQPPLPLSYGLGVTAAATPPPNAIASWRLRSPWGGVRLLYLIRSTEPAKD